MSTKRFLALDWLKVIMAIFVIGLHAKFLLELSQPLSYLSVNGLFRISVPVFFIINGYFFKNIITNKQKVVKWVKRVLLLYIVWMLIYAPFWFSMETPNNTMICIVFGYHHLWYLAATLFSGIALYFLRSFKQIHLFILGFVLCLIGLVIQYIGNFNLLDHKKLNSILNMVFIYRNGLFFGLPFFILGFLMNSKFISDNTFLKQNKTYLTLVALLLLLIESFFNFYLNGEPIDILLMLYISSPLIFYYAINFDLKLNSNSKNIAVLSTALYLIHPLIEYGLKHIFKIEYTILFIATTIISLIMSLVIIAINKKIKILL